jgi:hypothetical protein
VEKPQGKRPLLKPRLRWKDNIKMDFQKIGWVNGLDLSGSGEEQGTDSCECGNEHPGSRKCGELHE